LVTISSDDAPSYATVALWAKRFRDGRQSVEDDDRIGRPIAATTEENIRQVKAIVTEDPFVTIRDLEDITDISLGSLHSILHEYLGLKKVCSRWVPHLLTPAQKEERVETSRSLLSRFRRMGKNSFLRVVTGDETWVHYFEPKRKQQNMVWIAEGDHPPQMAKRERTRDKVMYAIFFNGDGPIAQIPTPPGRTITGNYYSDSVLPYVQKQYTAKHPNEPLRLHHDNAPAHRSGVVMGYLEEQGIQLIPHPPYSPDLAPCDFWLFSRLKDHLRGTRYDSRSQLGSVIFQYMKQVPVQEYADCYDSWKLRLQKCISVGGEYFEQL
jgi:histone-lysine N-methyltransferase SETMAR